MIKNSEVADVNENRYLINRVEGTQIMRMCFVYYNTISPIHTLFIILKKKSVSKSGLIGRAVMRLIWA